MPHTKGRRQTPAEHRASKRNSHNSPWRTEPALHSKRQRKCAAYFEELKRKGDNRRKPRPELDPE